MTTLADDPKIKAALEVAKARAEELAKIEDLTKIVFDVDTPPSQPNYDHMPLAVHRVRPGENDSRRRVVEEKDERRLKQERENRKKIVLPEQLPFNVDTLESTRSEVRLDDINDVHHYTGHVLKFYSGQKWNYGRVIPEEVIVSTGRVALLLEKLEGKKNPLFLLTLELFQNGLTLFPARESELKGKTFWTMGDIKKTSTEGDPSGAQ